MQFQNKSNAQLGGTPNDELEAAKRELIEIYTRIDSLRRDEKLYQDKTKELEVISKEITDCLQHKSELEASIESLKKEQDNIERMADAVSQNKKAEIEAVELEIVEKTKTKNLLDENISSIQIEISRLEQSMLVKENDLKIKVEDFNLIIDEKTKNRQQLEEEAGSIKVEIEALTQKKESLLKIVKDLEIEEGNKRKVLEDITNEIVVAIEKLDLINKEAEDKVAEMEEFEKTKKSEYAAIETRLNEREGIISEKEGWLATKEETLKASKIELEAFYGRKINNVQFN